MTSTRSSLRSRYLRTGIGELAAAGVFMFIGVRAAGNASSARWAVALCTLPLVFFLVGVGCYWLRARGWVGISTMPVPLAHGFQWFRRMHLLLLSCGLLGLLIEAPRLHPTQIALCVGALAFAGIEHVNYFHRRLAYPLRQWLSGIPRKKMPRLRKDIEDALRAAGP